MRSGCCGCSARRLTTWRSYSPSTVCSTSSWRVGSDRRWVSATCWCTTDGPGQPRDFITALARLAGSSLLRKLGDHSLVRAGGRDRRCGGGLHHHASAQAYQHQRQTRGRPQHPESVRATPPVTFLAAINPTRDAATFLPPWRSEAPPIRFRGRLSLAAATLRRVTARGAGVSIIWASRSTRAVSCRAREACSPAGVRVPLTGNRPRSAARCHQR